MAAQLGRGDRFGYWTVVKEAESAYKKRRYLCRCDCGRERIVCGYTLRKGASTSCGCSKRINTIASIMGRLIIQPNGCCTWPGLRHNFGYGITSYHGRTCYVHRLLYEHFVGPVPEGMVLDHVHCDNPPCANWAHLQPTTNTQNVSRKHRNGSKTHCKNGHPLSGDNLIVQKLRGSYMARVCRTCRIEYDKQRWARKKEERNDAAGDPIPQGS